MATEMATVGIMGKRREYGTGSVYQRKSDGLWIGTLEAGFTTSGRRRRVTVSAKTKGEAQRRLRDRRHQIEIHGATDLDPRATVKRWADQWLPEQGRTLRPSSYVATRSALRNWIIPTFGHKRIGDLTPADVRAVTDAQRAAGRSASTTRRTYSVLMSLLKAAQLEGHPVPQRLFATTAPANSTNDRDAMTVEQALAILPWAGELHHGSRFLAALMQGLRQGEALGLTWDQVDLATGTLTVSWQLKPLPYSHGCDGGDREPSCGRRAASCPSATFRVPDGYESRRLAGALHLARPKSRAGYRVIPIVPVMTEALERWKQVQADLVPDNPHNLVWPNLDGAPTYYKVDDEEWYGLQQAADVQHPAGRLFTIHEARHTTATLLLECGVDPSVIVAIMGHSDILTTRGYQHVRTERAREALQLVAERLQISA